MRNYIAKSIGEVLKEIRVQAGLTQKEMCDGVCSVSAYSKIERGVHEIDIETLISILSRNSVMLVIEDLFKTLLVNSTKINGGGKDAPIAIDLNMAFMANDLDALNKLKIKIHALPDNKKLLENWKLMYSSLSKKDKSFSLNQSAKKKIESFRRVENQNIISLTQLQLLLPYLSSEESFLYIKIIWDKVNFKYLEVSNIPFIFLKSYVKVIILHLELLLKRHAKKEDFKEPLEIINTILKNVDYQPIVSLGIKAKKIESIINRDEKTYKKIIKVEKIMGLCNENITEEVNDHPYYRKHRR